MRYLVDASALMALANTGHLTLLRDALKEVQTTETALSEVLRGGPPEAEVIQAALDAGWLQLTGAPGGPPTPSQTLGPGESSLLAVADQQDILILDDREARHAARTRGFSVTGLLGVLVHGVATGYLDKDQALRILEDLAGSDFRMPVSLYRWTRDHIEGTGA